MNDPVELADGTNPNNASSYNSLNKGLVAYYPFNGNTQDASGNGRHAVNSNATLALGVQGQANTSYRFNGNNSYMTAAGIPVPTNNAFTWSVWLNPESDKPYQAIFERAQALGNNALSPYLFLHPDRSVQFISYPPDNWGISSPAGIYQTNRWVQVVLTSATNGLRQLYVDGIFVNEKTTSEYGHPLELLIFGADRLLRPAQVEDLFYQGRMDEVRIYNRALTPTEVGQLYSAETPNHAPVASGSATLAAVPQGVLSYVLQGEQVGNLFWNNFSDVADQGRTNGLFVTKLDNSYALNVSPEEHGNEHAFAALKSDGSVVAWGDPASGGDISTVSNQLAGGVMEIYCSKKAFAALKTNGAVVTWGSSAHGGDSSAVASLLADGVREIYSSSGAFAALKGDGSVVTWGDPSKGGNSSSAVELLGSGVNRIVTTGNTFAAIKNDTTAVVWYGSFLGVNTFIPPVSNLFPGQEGGYAVLRQNSLLSFNGDFMDVAMMCLEKPGPDKINFVTNGVISVFSSGRVFAALKSDGSLVTWGGDVNQGGFLDSRVASQLRVVKLFRVGSGGFAALQNDGSVFAWGEGNRMFSNPFNAQAVASGVLKIIATSSSSAALKDDGALVVWGDSYSGGDSSAVASSLLNGVVDASATVEAFAARKADGSVVTWGAYGWGGDSSAVASRLSNGVVDIFSTYGAFAALKSDGSVVTWGSSANGGDSTSVASQLSNNVVTLASPFLKSRLVPGNALAGALVVGNAATTNQGLWQYSTNGFHWSNIPSDASDSSALPLNTVTQVRFAPATSFSGTPGGLTVRLLESGGAPIVVGQIVNAEGNGGSSQISAQTVILNTYVTPAPDTQAPLITLIGADPLEIYKGSTFTDPGATVTDNVDATRTITGSGTLL
ncbi:MAG: hypothetical protein EBZ78_07690 [Verrucomicrobia bacterium]|nr:hypothetical protein [Verrucomicrobiota bacterium]